MDYDCEICGRDSSTSLNLFGDHGTLRIQLCDDCSAKAKRRDPVTWEKIREVLCGD